MRILSLACVSGAAFLLRSACSQNASESDDPRSFFTTVRYSDESCAAEAVVKLTVGQGSYPQCTTPGEARSSCIPHGTDGTYTRDFCGIVESPDMVGLTSCVTTGPRALIKVANLFKRGACVDGVQYDCDGDVVTQVKFTTDRRQDCAGSASQSTPIVASGTCLEAAVALFCSLEDTLRFVGWENVARIDASDVGADGSGGGSDNDDEESSEDGAGDGDGGGSNDGDNDQGGDTNDPDGFLTTLTYSDTEACEAEDLQSLMVRRLRSDDPDCTAEGEALAPCQATGVGYTRSYCGVLVVPDVVAQVASPGGNACGPGEAQTTLTGWKKGACQPGSMQYDCDGTTVQRSFFQASPGTQAVCRGTRTFAQDVAQSGECLLNGLTAYYCSMEDAVRVLGWPVGANPDPVGSGGDEEGEEEEGGDGEGDGEDGEEDDEEDEEEEHGDSDGDGSDGDGEDSGDEEGQVSTDEGDEGSDDGDGAACFSAASTVQVEGQPAPRRIQDLCIGDRILTANQAGELSYSDVVFLPHGPNDVAATFLDIRFTTQSGPSTLSATPAHLVAEADCASGLFGALVRADSLVPGTSCLFTAHGAAPVRTIEQVARRGIYSVVTERELLVVDGVVASPFAVSHALPHAYYHLHRALYALAPEALLSATVAVRVVQGAVIAPLAIMLGEAVLPRSRATK